MKSVKEKKKICAFIVFTESIIEQPRLQGTLEDHLIQTFVGKGA